MKDFWNKRYTEDSFAYGTLPNAYMKQELDKLAPGSLLLPAEGEGRNAMYAVSKGWDVIAFDYSSAAQKKALQLSEKTGLSLDYQVMDVLNFRSSKKFDVVGLCYAHFPVDIRANAHLHLLQFLKPGGVVIFEAFSKTQLGKASGGPKNEEMLFSIQEIKKEFKGLDFEFLEEIMVYLNEGEYHQGEASVIRFVGKLS